MDFSNTTGAEIICQSRGTPLPKIKWVKTDGTEVKDVPGLRQVEPFPVLNYDPYGLKWRNILMFRDRMNESHRCKNGCK